MTLAILLLLAAFALVLAEVFFPSLGAFGIIAAACAWIGTAEAFAFSRPVGWAFVAAIVLVTPTLIWLGFKWLPHTGIGSRMVLAEPEGDPGAGAPVLEHLVGQVGEAITDLRPAGTVRIDGERVTVVCLGGLIERGQSVKVIAVEGPEVRVRAHGATP